MDQQDKSGLQIARGPWTFIEDGRTEEGFNAARPLTVCDADGNDLASFYSEDDATVSVTRAQAIAHARLFAASPSLYEALRAYVEYTEAGIATDEADAGEIELMERARTALANATGSQQ